jgi:hypothetical protein
MSVYLAAKLCDEGLREKRRLREDMRQKRMKEESPNNLPVLPPANVNSGFSELVETKRQEKTRNE